ncbi:hypothetical protein LSAT2_017496 [Lamellibrachia satsuma]|nr:hypothetical protein LSAT2_017496 [Lamellibrachia satsuma]
MRTIFPHTGRRLIAGATLHIVGHLYRIHSTPPCKQLRTPLPVSAASFECGREQTPTKFDGNEFRRPCQQRTPHIPRRLCQSARPRTRKAASQAQNCRKRLMIGKQSAFCNCVEVVSSGEHLRND